MPPNTNRGTNTLTVPGTVVLVPYRHRSTPPYADAVVDACAALVERSGDPIVRMADIVAELNATGSGYPIDTYKAIQRLSAEPCANGFRPSIERVDRHRLMLNSDAD